MGEAGEYRSMVNSAALPKHKGATAPVHRSRTNVVGCESRWGLRRGMMKRMLEKPVWGRGPQVLQVEARAKTVDEIGAGGSTTAPRENDVRVCWVSPEQKGEENSGTGKGWGRRVNWQVWCNPGHSRMVGRMGTVGKVCRRMVTTYWKMVVSCEG